MAVPTGADPTHVCELAADRHTVILDHFNGAAQGVVKGTPGFVAGLPGLGQAIEMGQGSWVRYSLAADSRNELNSQGTIELWVKPRKHNTGILNINWGAVESYPAAGHVVHFRLNAEGKVTIGGWPPACGFDPGVAGFVGNGIVPLDQWSHVAISWGEKTKIYINGKLDYSSDICFRPAVSGSYAYLHYWGADDFGLIDELQISKVQRTDTEMLSRVLAGPNCKAGSITLSPATSPNTGQPGTTVVTLNGSGFPAGTILPKDVVVVFEPAQAGGGPVEMVEARAVTNLVGTTKRVSVLVPEKLVFAAPASYLVWLSGMTTTGTAFWSANKSAITIQPPAELLSVTPGSATPGVSLTVTLTGRFTNFVQGSTRASFGPGVSVGGAAEGAFGAVTVESATTAKAEIQISATAAAGARDVTIATGVQTATAKGAFAVVSLPPPPVISGLNPASALQGQTLNVSVTGQFTNFAQGVSAVNLGAGITVNSVVVASATSLTANVTIAPAAALGARTLTVTTGVELVSLASGFTVQPGIPVLLTVAPNSGQQGQANLDVVINGQYTHFAQGSTAANFGAGITVTGVTVSSPTSLTAKITLAADAAVGPRTVTVTTVAEVVTLAGGFTVQAKPNAPPVVDAGPDQTVSQSWDLLVSSNAGTEDKAGEAVLRFDGKTGQFRNRVTEIRTSDGIYYPVELLVDAANRLFVGIQGYPQLPERAGINRYDVGTGTFIDSFIPLGSGGLGAGGHFAVGPDGHIYMPDWTNGDVKRYHGQTGAFLGVFATDPYPSRRPNGITFGPDGHMYLTDTIDVLKFHGQTGTLLGVFANGPSNGLAQVNSPLFGPDGNLYVAGLDSANVGRFDGRTGAFIDAFVPPGSGGLVRSQGLQFGPDGNLYVADLPLGPSNAGKVLRYNGQSGQFLDVFVPPGSGGLLRAMKIYFHRLGSAIVLSGVATDDGLPSGSSLALLWEKVSGPGYVKFDNAMAASTTAEFGNEGVYVLRLTASDSELQAFSEVKVVVTAVNRKPLVDAGPDLTVAIPGSVTLDGSATDDGLPVGSTMTLTWSVVSGPGAVTFGNPNSASTTAGFTVAGTYVLRLTASDSVLAASDDTTITVLAPVNRPPVAVDDSFTFVGEPAGLGPETVDAAYRIEKAAHVPGAAALALSRSGTPFGDYLYVASYERSQTLEDPIYRFRPGDPTVEAFFNLPPESDFAAIEFGPGAPYTSGLYISSNNRDTKAGIPDGQDNGGSIVFLDSDPHIKGEQFLTAPPPPGALSEPSSMLFAQGGGYGTELLVSNITDPPYGIMRVGPSGTASVFASFVNRRCYGGSMRFGRGGGFGTDLYIACDPNLVLRVSEAGVIDLYREVPAVERMGTVMFSPGGTFGQDAYFTAAKQNVLTLYRLKADGDIVVLARSLLSSPPTDLAWDSLEFSQDGNSLFVAVIGFHAVFRMFHKAAPDGAVLPNDSDPDGDSLTAILVQGPSNGSLTLNADGTFYYTPKRGFVGSDSFTYKANDGSLDSNTATVTITVVAPPTQNFPPTVNAGSNQQVTLPSSATVNGRAHDDGLPQGSTLTYTWSKLSGPGTVTFTAPSSPTTNASFSLAGDYVLRLTVSDSVLTSSDDVQVTVTGAVPVPTLTSVSPNTGQQGQVNLNVAITGSNTAFAQGTTTLSLGSGVTVNSVAVSSPTALSAAVSIAADAAIGLRTVTVTTGSEVVSLPGGFSVTAAPVVPAITSVSPSSGQQGQVNLSLLVTGQATNFAQGVSTVSLGAGITVNSVTVASNMSLTANITIAAGAAVGARTVAVTTGTEVVSLSSGFQVTTGTPAIISIIPASAMQGQTAKIALGANFTGFVQGVTQARFGQGISVGGAPNGTFGPVAVSDSKSATAHACVGIDSASRRWRHLYTVGIQPPGLVGASIVFDELSNRLVVFGGGSADGPNPVGKNQIDKVFLLSHATGLLGQPIWNELTISGPGPAPRKQHAAVYDQSTRRMVIFGGCLDGNCAQRTNDTWVLENANGEGGQPSWIQLTPASAPPAGRIYLGAYDQTSNRMIAYSHDSSVWALTNANGLGGPPAWQQLTTSGQPPAPTDHGYSATYDPTSNRLIIFGTNPITQPGPAADGPWVLTNANGLGGTPTWIKLSPLGPHPPMRFNHGAVYDPLTNEMTIFAGAIAAGTEANDAWVLKYANGLGGTPQWVKVEPTGPVPAVWQNATGVLDPCSKRIITLVALFSDSWTLSNITAAANPGPRTVTVKTNTEEVSQPDAFTIGATNQAPDVSAGPDLTITLPATAVLVGSISDDGMPAGGTLTATWSKTAGPGVVSFANQSTASTTASFSEPGSYVLRLTASDSGLLGMDQVTIIVNPTTGTAPLLLSVVPSSGQQGGTGPVVIRGQNTSFAQGVSTVSLGAGITVNSVSVASATSLTANITIAAGAGVGPRTVTVTTGSEVVSLPSGFQVTAGTTKILSLNPASAMQGQTANIALGAEFTNFVQGVTQASFGAGITVNSVTVASGTSLSANITVSPAAVVGPRTITVTTGVEVVTLADVFQVTAGVPQFTLISPGSAPQGAALQLNVTSSFTNFQQGVTQVSLGSGITVGVVTVSSTTSLTAALTVEPAAAPGPRTLTVTTGAQVVTQPDAFTVTAGAAYIESANPGGGYQGETLDVQLTGKFTSFSQGSTVVSLGAGITINSVKVASPTSLTANVTISPSAAIGLRDITVTTGAEVATFPGGFQVVAGIPDLLTVSPNTAKQGETLTVTLTGQFTHFAQGTTQANFDTGITVNSITVSSPTSFTANITIASNAPTGPRAVIVTTGAEVVGLNDAFTVVGTPRLLSATPNTGQQGQQNLNVVVAGQFTNFAAGVSQASFGAGVTVNSVTVTTASSLTANLSIDAAAALGLRTVTVTTGAEVVTLVNGFGVTASANQAPVIKIAPTWSVVLPARLLITYTVVDDGKPAGGALTVSWDKISGPGEHGFKDQTIGQNPDSISVGFSAPGTYILRITATDTQSTAAKDITVSVTGTPPDVPTVSIATPVEGQNITTFVDVTGTANSPDLKSWTLEMRPVEESLFRTLATGSAPVLNAKLGVLDPTLLLNGNVELRVKGTDHYGQTSTSAVVTVVLTGNQKIGHFTVSFKDYESAEVGVPIQLIRTYDSRSLTQGDFGVGWRLDIRHVRLRDNGTMGKNWQGTRSGGVFPTYCIVATKPHIVTVTDSVGEVYKFQASVSPNCQQLVQIQQATLVFSQVSGPKATLSLLGSNQVMVVGSWPGSLDLWDLNEINIVDIEKYRLTLPDGRSMEVSRTYGLEKLTDLNANSITITPAGIVHSNGRSIAFTRDMNGRITQVTDPAGKTLRYAYDQWGNLESFTDQASQVSNYTYDTAHRLLTIKDPRGIEPIRNEYDSDGRLIGHLDAFGNLIAYEHDFANRREVVTDRLGNTTVNEYDSNGNVIKVTDPLGGVMLRTYDARDNMTKEIDPLGRVREYTYDGNDNRTSEKDPLGNVTSYAYNALNRVTKITDALGQVTENFYDANGNLTSTKDALGNTTSYTYNSRGLVTSMTDPLNRVTVYSYDGAGRGLLQAETNPLNQTTNYTYDASGNRTRETRQRATPSGPETLVTQYEYDALNRLVKTTYPDGSTTQTAYNAIGKQSETTDQLGRKTTYLYDAMGRLTQTTYADLTSEKSEYDKEGRRTKSIDKANRATTFEYDKLGRLTKTIFPDSTSTSSVYDAAGQVVRSIDARNNATEYQYDAAGRRTKVTDALGRATSFSYDKAGNQESMTDANGNTTQFQYDKLNRRIRVVHPDSTLDQTAYDALGRTTMKTDQNGRTTQYEYDELGRLITVIDAKNQLTRYAYDEAGNRLTQTDANNNITRFDYDKLGRRTKRTLPLGMFETMAYDAAGNLKTKVDFNGRITTYDYDEMNRLRKKTPDPAFAAQPVTFNYTATGLRSEMVDPSGTTTYVYDQRNRLTSKNTPQGTLTYTYDQQGNLASIRSSNSGGTSVDYAYDALNRLAQVTDNRLTPGATTYQYDLVGNLKSYTYPNNVTHTYTYSKLNRLTDLAVTSGATPIASYSYTLGPSGNRTKVVELGGRTVDYSYDELYRLTGETITGGMVNGTIGYVYDPVGNRKTRTSTVAPVPPQSFTYDANDRLDSDTYDANGNTISSGGVNYTYDYENRLVTKNGAEVVIIYDGDGNRVAKTVGGVTTRYLVDTQNQTGYAQVLEEIVGGNLARVCTYGLNRISQSQTSGTSFYGYDGQGSVRLLADGSGSVKGSYLYDSFGVDIEEVGTTLNNYRYAGEDSDSDLGMYHLRARYFASSTGRFVTMDSFDGMVNDPFTMHKYVYAHANPVNNFDPSGNYTLPQVSLAAMVVWYAGANYLYWPSTLRATLSGKTCGPDLQMNLKEVLTEVETEFWQWGGNQCRACQELITLPNALGAWDIMPLFQNSRRYPYHFSSQADFAAGTGEIGGKCFAQGAMNYAIFGKAMRLCSEQFGSAYDLTNTLDKVRHYRTWMPDWRLPYLIVAPFWQRSYVPQALTFAEYGWTGNYSPITSGGSEFSSITTGTPANPWPKGEWVWEPMKRR